MARYTDSVCRLCRREGMKLYFKGEKCYTDKCPVDKRPYPPGQHGPMRGKISEYALRLREKQKVKWVYGLMETQFKNTFRDAERMKGATGENLLQLLERRLDSVVYRMNLTASRAQARQMVTHGYILLNGRPMNIPSCRVGINDAVELVEGKKKDAVVLENLKVFSERRPVPGWLSFDPEKMKGTVVRVPERDDVTYPPIREELIVELYSK